MRQGCKTRRVRSSEQVSQISGEREACKSARNQEIEPAMSTTNLGVKSVAFAANSQTCRARIGTKTDAAEQRNGSKHHFL